MQIRRPVSRRRPVIFGALELMALGSAPKLPLLLFVISLTPALEERPPKSIQGAANAATTTKLDDEMPIGCIKKAPWNFQDNPISPLRQRKGSLARAEVLVEVYGATKVIATNDVEGRPGTLQQRRSDALAGHKR